jgi:phosphatidylglycerol:prolipoprotein diacylglycerol transferase
VQPILFHIGSHGVPAYASALAVAFAAGILVAIRRARQQGLDPAVVIDVSTLIILTAIFGSRLIWVVSHPDLHRPPAGSWAEALNPFAEMGRGGLVGLSVTGGLPLAVAAALLFFAYRRLPVLVYADLLAPSVALGEAITRIGCFFNGCCHGLASALPWAVSNRMPC